MTDPAGLAQGLHLGIRSVVLEALTHGVGATLSTNVEFKSRFNIGAGTMQRALDLLRDRGAVTVVNRGHLGRRIEQLDVGQAWQAAGLAPVRLILPPSGPIEIDVLASRLADGLTNLGISHTVHQLRGGAGRLASLRSRIYDLAIVSAGTWAGAVTAAPAEMRPKVVRKLTAGTYYAPRRLVVVSRQGQGAASVKKIAIDRQSSDHVALTVTEFPEEEGFEYVEVPFPSVPAWVLRDRVDAGIWHETASVIPLDLAGIELRQIQRPRATEAWNSLSGATLVGSEYRPELRSVVEAMNLDDLRPAQQAALASSIDDSLV